ncbi:MAG: immunity 17 family protein [Candidatus Eremiobacterota bacterium]|jgi:predicted small integral membrane protein
MSENVIIGILIILSGLFSLISSIKNWEFFFSHTRARFLVRILGRTGARIFYGLLGSALFLGGLLMACNIIRR